MVCKVERWGEDAARPADKQPGEVKSMTFHCDYEGCDVSPTDEEIIAAGGLKYMGWFANGGKHFCPHHNPERAA